MMDNSLSRIATSDNDSGSKTVKKLVIKNYDPNEQHKVQHKPRPPSIPNNISRRGRTAVHPLPESHSSASDNDQDDNYNKERNTTTKKNIRSRKTHNSPSHSRIKNTRIVPTNSISTDGQHSIIQSPYRRGSLHSLDSNSSLNNQWSVYQGSLPTSTPQQSNKTESRLPTSGRLSKIGLGVDRQQSFSKSETDLRPKTLPPIQSSHHNNDDSNNANHIRQSRIDSYDYNLNRQYHSDQNLKRLGEAKTKLSSMSLDDHNISKMTKFNHSTVMLPLYTDHIRNGTYESQQNQFELERYFPDRQVSLFVGTWNMHGEKVVPIPMDDFLLPSSSDVSQDIYVIGAQECCVNRREWEIKLQQTLGASYVLKHSAIYGVLYMAIFIRRDLIWFCSDMIEGRVSTRPGSMIRTKGALALAFTLFDTSLLFVTSHLAAHNHKVRDRINDYDKICKNLNMKVKRSEAASNKNVSNGSTAEIDCTEQFDHVIWFGDLNFRLDASRDKVDNMLLDIHDQQAPQYQNMLKIDQLIQLMKSDEIFRGYHEMDINFPPTYKYDLNSERYDTSSKSRVPSWTDRILYKSKDEEGLKMYHYDHCNEIKISDHRPVYGLFSAKLNDNKNRRTICSGNFNQNIYIEGNKRRRSNRPGTQQQSAICTIL